MLLFSFVGFGPETLPVAAWVGSGADRAFYPRQESRLGGPGFWQVQQRWTSWFLS